MAFKIGVLEADQLPTERPRSNSKIKRSIAELLIRRLLAVRINKFLIQMVVIESCTDPTTGRTLPISSFVDGPLGVGNLLPFSKSQNKDVAPERLHYAIPARGDHRRCWANRFMAAPRC